MLIFRRLFPLVFIAWCLILLVPPAHATVDFSCQTSLSCAYCHENPDGGGTLTIEGDAFRSAGFELTDKVSPPLWPKLLRLAIGFLHVLAAFIWLGAIFYVHLFMGPRSLTSGLPKSEVRLGRISILVISATGLALTFYRITSPAELVSTTFGIVYLVKVGLFLLMVVIAAVATTRIDRLLRESGKRPDDEKEKAHITYDGKIYDVSQSRLWKDGAHMGRHRVGQDLTEAMAGAPHGPEVLEKVTLVDTEDNPAEQPRFIYDGMVYDVSQSRMWKNGVHMGRHRVGQDLTQAMASAPHGPEVLERVTKVGPADSADTPEEPTALKWFVRLANSALVFGVLIILCVAYWKMGPAHHPGFGYPLDGGHVRILHRMPPPGHPSHLSRLDRQRTRPRPGELPALPSG